MSIIKSIRERLDHQLERWDARLDALEAQLGETRDETLERVRAGQQRLAAISEQVEERLEDVADLSEEKALDLRTELQALRVQLALGKAETKDVFESQQARINHALSSAEAGLSVLEHRAQDRVADEVESFVRAADRLRADLDAAQVQFALAKADARDVLAERRHEFSQRLQTMRTRLRETGKEAGHKLGKLEDELAEDIAAYRESLSDFFRHI